MAFTAVFCFQVYSALLDMGTKMPPAGHRRPHKRRGTAGECRDTLEAPEGTKNPPQVVPGRAAAMLLVDLV